LCISIAYTVAVAFSRLRRHRVDRDVKFQYQRVEDYSQWVPTWLIIGLYNKVVKQEGHDQFDRGYHQ